MGGAIGRDLDRENSRVDRLKRELVSHSFRVDELEEQIETDKLICEIMHGITDPAIDCAPGGPHEQ